MDPEYRIVHKISDHGLGELCWLIEVWSLGHQTDEFGNWDTLDEAADAFARMTLSWMAVPTELE